MRITILDGTPAGPGVENLTPLLERLAADLAARRHEVHRCTLRDQKIAQCRGCFECWLKTPGECTTRDQAEPLLASIIASDLLLFASPMIMGFPSALLKRATERLLPLIHPYFESVDGEIHHRRRYARYPRFVLLYGQQGCDDEDARIVERIWRRAAVNFRTTLAFTASTGATSEELSHAIDRL